MKAERQGSEMAVVKNRNCEGGNEFWNHVEKVASHTPAPWEFVADLDGDHAIWAGDALVAVTDGWPMATTRLVNGNVGRTREEDEANARVMSAAPEMLEALIEFVAYSECHCGGDDSKSCAYCLGTAALVKAGVYHRQGL